MYIHTTYVNLDCNLPSCRAHSAFLLFIFLNFPCFFFGVSTCENEIYAYDLCVCVLFRLLNLKTEGKERRKWKKILCNSIDLSSKRCTFLKYNKTCRRRRKWMYGTQIVWNVLFHLIQSMGGVGIAEEHFMHANNRKIIYCSVQSLLNGFYFFFHRTKNVINKLPKWIS